LCLTFLINHIQSDYKLIGHNNQGKFRRVLPNITAPKALNIFDFKIHRILGIEDFCFQ